MKTFNAKRVIYIILLIAMTLSLTGCFATTNYTDDEKTEFDENGKNSVADWYSNNKSKPITEKYDIEGSIDGQPYIYDYSLTDAYEGDIITYDSNNNEIYDHFFYSGYEDKMYTNNNVEYADELIVQKYAEGFGLKEYTYKKCSIFNLFSYPIEIQVYKDEDVDENIESIERVVVYESYLPEELKKEDISSFLDEYLKDYCSESACIPFYLNDEELSLESLDLSYLKHHRFIDNFVFYNKDETEKLEIRLINENELLIKYTNNNTTKDSEESDNTLHRTHDEMTISF